MKKRILSFFLVLCLVIGYMPAISVVTQAAGSSIIYVSDFESLKEAFATVQTENGKVVTTRIKLTQDINFVPNKTITIRSYGDAPRSVQLDLNGHSLYKNDNAVYMFHVGYTGNLNNDYDDNKVDETYLEIINSNKAVTSKMTLIKENSKTAKFAQVKHKGHMVIGGDDGGPIEISRFVHSAIQVGNLDNYSFIPNFQATVDIKNGVTIKDCKTHSSVSKEYGGGIYVYKGGTANLYDGTTIEGCTCCKTNTTRQDEGGGVYVAGTFNMYGGTIKNCVAESAESRGGGVYVATGGTFNMYDGLITENSAAAGGGVGLWGGHFNMYGGEIKNNYASNCGNEIAMLYGTEDISVTINGGKITHEASYSGCGSQLFVNGENSKMQILTGSEILLDGKKNGFGGSGDVLIKGGYLKVQGLSSAFAKAPTIENMDMASGDRDAEKMILSPTEADFYKPGVILGEKGKLMVTVTFEHPIMSDFLPNTTPDPVKVIKGTCLLSLPVVSDTNGKYFYAGWKNEYETGGGYWSLSTPVDKSITLTSQWNQYNVYFKDVNGKPVGGFDFETTYGYSYNESEQIIISNQNAPVILNVDNSYKYFEISQFYAGGNQGYTYTLPSNGQCGLYIKPKSNVDAGTYSENIVVQMSADGNDYSAERTIPVTLVVKKGKPEIMSSPIADFTYGQTLEDAVLTGGKATQFQYYDEETKSFLRDVSGKFTFVDGSIKPCVGDAQPFDVVFTPDDIVNYEEVKCKGYAYVGKMVIKDLQTPTIGYSIPYGTPLSEIELPTGWKWADESIVPKPGVSQQVVYFEFEEDLSNYDFSGSQSSELDFENNRVMKKTSVETEKLNPIVDWPTASDIKQGQKLSDSVLSGGSAYVVINGKTVDVPGTFEWKSPNEIPAVGTNYYGVVFAPDNTDYYESDESEISVKTMETFTVDFMPDNGTKISSQTIAIGGKITEPSNVTKDGYSLLGWYKGDTKWNFDNDTVTENILLKAKWKDITAPTGEISIGTDRWTEFFNDITFGLFFKDSVKVTVTAKDNGDVEGQSSNCKIEYQKVKEGDSYDENGIWTAYDISKGISVPANDVFVIYARITDEAGNSTVINSDGVVVYTDSVITPNEIEYTYKQNEDRTVQIALNGNTFTRVTDANQNEVVKLTDADGKIVPAESYVLDDSGKLTLKATYLDTLKSGEYDYKIYMNPLGKETDKVTLSYNLTVKVKKAENAPNMPESTKSVSYSTKKIGDVGLPDNWTWQEADRETELEVGKEVLATAVYTGADAGNYRNESIVIKVTRAACEHTHTELLNQKEATCSETGYTGDVCCIDCGKQITQGREIQKKKHTPKEAVKENEIAATCTTDGSYDEVVYCDVCNEKISSTHKIVKALGHDYTSKITKQATKDSEGIRTYTCSHCGDSYQKSIPKLQGESFIKSDDGKTKMDAFIKWTESKFTVIWEKVPDADGYDIYAAKCGKKMNAKSLVKTVKGEKFSATLTKIAGKKISNKKAYKIKIKAYKLVDGKKIYIASSQLYHAAGKNSKIYTNAKKIKVSSKSISINKGKTGKIKAKIVKESKTKKLLPKGHGPTLRYYSTDKSIATVTAKGKIKAKQKGSCYIYIKALNGVTAKVKVTVK